MLPRTRDQGPQWRGPRSTIGGDVRCDIVADMAKPIDVLVLESESGASDGAAASLEAAGHNVHRCHDAGAKAFPCRGLGDDRCPLDSGTIDVALTVRAHPRSVPAALEDGVSCALQHRIPLVVSGRVALNPYDEYATVVVDGRADVVAAVESAVSTSLRQHEFLAVEAARRVLALRKRPRLDVSAHVHRAGGVVQVVVEVPADTDRATRDVVATRVHAALRAYDRHARQIDIAVED